MFRFVIVEEKEPFKPIVILARMAEIPEEHPVQPEPEPCLVCKKETKAGFEVIVSNTSDDKMVVGRCCEHHEHTDVVRHAFKRLHMLLYGRIELVEFVECDKVKVLETKR